MQLFWKKQFYPRSVFEYETDKISEIEGHFWVLSGENFSIICSLYTHSSLEYLNSTLKI